MPPKRIIKKDKNKSKEGQEETKDSSEPVLEESKQSRDDQNDSLKKSIKITENVAPKLLAWCSYYNNEINTIDLETKQSYQNFKGATIKLDPLENSSTHVKEVSDASLLVSLHHDIDKANLEVFNLSQKGKAQRIYSFEEVSGTTGDGDVTYNSRRGLLGAIPVTGRIAYHLFTINAASKTDDIVKLKRKSKWHSQYNNHQYNQYKRISGFDFNPAGESLAIIDFIGKCFISDVDTNECRQDMKMDNGWDPRGRCRWSTNKGEPLLFVKYDQFKLNILDVEKGALTLTKPAPLDFSCVYWIDVCESNGNLLAGAGQDRKIKIFDKRESRVVKTLKEIHREAIYCVRWSPSGDLVASASADKKVKLWDFKTGKVLYTGTTSDGRNPRSVCFI